MNKKWASALLCALCLLIGMSLSSWADSHLQEIKAYLNGELRIQMDGQFVELKDANGNDVLPVSYNGTTYLPIRAISQLLDIDVHYDGENKIITLGDLQAQPAPDDRDGSIQLVSWSDRVEGDEVLVAASVQNKGSAGKTIGIVVTGYDAKGKAVEAKGVSGYVSRGAVRNFDVSLSGASEIESVEVDVTGYAADAKLRASGDRIVNGEIIVTGAVENGRKSGDTIGIVATGFDQNGRPVETKGISGYVSAGAVRNFSVSFEAAGIAYVEVEATGFADEVELLSEASRLKDGKLEVTAVVENGNNSGTTAGVVVTGYAKDGKAVDTKGASGYVSAGAVRNFSVVLDPGSEVDYIEVEVTDRD